MWEARLHVLRMSVELHRDMQVHFTGQQRVDERCGNLISTGALARSTITAFHAFHGPGRSSLTVVRAVPHGTMGHAYCVRDALCCFGTCAGR